MKELKLLWLVEAIVDEKLLVFIKVLWKTFKEFSRESSFPNTSNKFQRNELSSPLDGILHMVLATPEKLGAVEELHRYKYQFESSRI